MSAVRAVTRTVVGVTVAGLLLAACTTGSTDDGVSEAPAASPSASTAAAASPAADDGLAPEVNRTIRVGVQTIGSSRVVAELYARALQDAGFDVALTVPSTIGTFVEAMAKGQVDVLPVYLTGFTDYLYTSILNLNGSRPVTRDVDTTVAAANQYGADRGIRALAPAAAAEQPTFAVTRALQMLLPLAPLPPPLEDSAVRFLPVPACSLLPQPKSRLQGSTAVPPQRGCQREWAWSLVQWWLSVRQLWVMLSEPHRARRPPRSDGPS